MMMMMRRRRRRRPRQDRLVAVVVDGLLPEEHHGGVLALGDLPEQLGHPEGLQLPLHFHVRGSVGPHGQGGPEGVLRDRPKGSGQQREVESAEAAGIEGRGGGRGPSGGDGA